MRCGTTILHVACNLQFALRISKQTTASIIGDNFKCNMGRRGTLTEEDKAKFIKALHDGNNFRNSKKYWSGSPYDQ